jgi:hypothetical protein
MSTIKAGYRVTVKSWENDGDHYNTITKDGLSEEDVKLYVDILKLAREDFGNMYDPSDKELEDFGNAVKKVFDKHGRAYDESNCEEEGGEIIGEFCGYSEHYFTRVVEKITVEYVPQEIVIEDVTTKFGV